MLGRQVGVDTLPIVLGEDPVAIARRAETAARLQGYDVVLLDTAGRTHIDEPLMAEMARNSRRRAPARNPARRRRADRPGRGQPRQELQRAGRLHRHRADPHGRRRARRRGAVDALGHRQADQAPRRRREDGRARGFPSRAARRPHPRHGRHREPGREGGADHRRGAGGQDGREDAQGRVRSQRPLGATGADRKDGRDGRHHGNAAGRRQDQGSARLRQSRREVRQAPAGDHLVDDAASSGAIPTSSRRRARSASPRAPG